MDRYTVSFHTLDRGPRPEVVEVEAESPTAAVLMALVKIEPYPPAYHGADLMAPREYQRLSIEVRRA